MTFEYQTRKNLSDDEKNVLGAEGWELVAVTCKPDQEASGRIPEPVSFSHYFFFKREIGSKG